MDTYQYMMRSLEMSRAFFGEDMPRRRARSRVQPAYQELYETDTEIPDPVVQKLLAQLHRYLEGA
jgi:hypothetical protein